MATLESIVREQTSEIGKLKQELSEIKYNHNIVMVNNTSFQGLYLNPRYECCNKLYSSVQIFDLT